MKIGGRELKILGAFKANPGSTPRELGLKSDGPSIDLAEGGYMEEGYRHIFEIDVFPGGGQPTTGVRKERIFRVTHKGNNYLNVKGKALKEK